MKILIPGLLIAIASLGAGYWLGHKNIFSSEVSRKNEHLEKDQEKLSSSDVKASQEDFGDFLYNFMLDSLFQMNRVMFPFKSITGVDDIDTTFIARENWKIDMLFLGDQYTVQIYDNFESELRDTNERILAWEGVENGINVQYRFSRIKGLWYLIQYDDSST